MSENFISTQAKPYLSASAHKEETKILQKSTFSQQKMNKNSVFSETSLPFIKNYLQNGEMAERRVSAMFGPYDTSLEDNKKSSLPDPKRLGF